MPQLDPNVFSPQIIWLIITFLALYFVLSRKGLPQIAKVLGERNNVIDTDLEEAEQFRKESVEIEADYEKSLAEAKATATQTVRDARLELQSRLDDRKATVDAELSQRISSAEAKIKQARDEAMSELEDISVEACQAIVEKLSGQNVSKTDARNAIKEQIKASVS